MEAYAIMNTEIPSFDDAPKEKIQCQHCGRKFTTEDGLLRHVTEKHACKEPEQ